ncbi:protein mono-ADP-ribosyltransferase PARP14-like [Antedon mediterranea]|uniref:protein mono-ADP-ribosyltransferase PARP14-like n=1 Tax=Antedon mediterranea TaxID=105859 RepID=UPI003AF852B8
MDREVIIDTQNIKSNTIKLQGRRVNLMKAQTAIFDLTCKLHEAENEKLHEAEKREREKLHEEKQEKENQLILKDVKWFYKVDNNHTVAFNDDITVLLEKAYKKKEKWVKYYGSNNHEYEVNFKKKSETDLQLMKTYRVYRTILKDGVRLPPNWTPMKRDENLKVEDLNPSSSEYKLVERQFTDALAGQYELQSIVKISRIQNSELWKQYAAKKETFEMIIDNHEFEQLLYHGTDEQTLRKICNTGFDRGYAAAKNAAYYRNGSYFAVHASYSTQPKYSQPNANGEKHIFLCNVLVGECCQGEQGMIVPSPNCQSACDDPTDPTIIVTFKDAQAYPSYLITFK